MKRPAAGHVERLHPAADPEHREVALRGGGVEGQLVLVADAVDVGAEPRVRRPAVGAGVEIGAAAEEQAVEPVGERRRVVGEAVGGHTTATAPASWSAWV